MLFHVIMFVAVYPVLLIMYVCMRNNFKEQRDRYCGVCLKEEDCHTEELEQIEKHYVRGINLTTLVCALLPFSFLLVKLVSIQTTLWMAWLFGMILFFGFLHGKANKKVLAYKQKRQALQQQSPEDAPDLCEDDDRCWIWGLFYYNPKDKRTMVEKRLGMGFTTNMATPLGKVMMVVAVIACLSVPVLCVDMMLEEFMPIHISVEQEQLVCKHLKKDYQIPLEDITKCELEPMVTTTTKSSGVAMDNLKKGKFYIKGQGGCQVFLNPQNKKVIRLEVGEDVYYIGGYDDRETEEVYEQLR